VLGVIEPITCDFLKTVEYRISLRTQQRAVRIKLAALFYCYGFRECRGKGNKTNLYEYLTTAVPQADRFRQLAHGYIILPDFFSVTTPGLGAVLKEVFKRFIVR
jgi:hypothetical protein